jgi:hypothetical protein
MLVAHVQLVELHDARMPQPGEGAKLFLQGLLAVGPMKHLDRDLPLALAVEGAEHGPLPAARQRLANFEALCAGHGAHRPPMQLGQGVRRRKRLNQGNVAGPVDRVRLRFRRRPFDPSRGRNRRHVITENELCHPVCLALERLPTSTTGGALTRRARAAGRAKTHSRLTDPDVIG